MKINPPMRMLIAALLLGPMLGSLSAQQSVRSVGVGAKSVIQQLTALLTPVNITVIPSVLAVSETASTREFRIRWAISPASPPPGPPQSGPPPVGSFSISGQHRYAEAPLRQAVLELAPDHLFIATVDKNSRLKSWSDILDPRIVRSEGAGADGAIHGRALYLEQAEFLLSVPDDPENAELQFYLPQSLPTSDGSTFSLQLIGRVGLGQ